MKIRSIGSLILCAYLMLTVTAVGQAQSSLPVIRIGIVTDGDWARNRGMIDTFKSEIIQVNAGEFDIRFPSDGTVSGGWTRNGIRQSLDGLLSAPEIDLILTLGFVSSNQVCLRRDLIKPVIAPLVIDAELQGIPLKKGVSGVNNLNYLNAFRSLSRTVQTFRSIVPFTRLVVVADTFIFQEIPALKKIIRQMADSHSLNINVIDTQTSSYEVLENLPPDTQAVMLTVLPRMPLSEFEKLIDGLMQKKLPSFSYWGQGEVKQGIFATVAPESLMQNIARNAAINAQDILRGENADNIPVAINLGKKLYINMATARAIDVSPTWKVLTEAELLNEEVTEAGRVLNLERVVQEALLSNLDLAIADRNVLVGEQSVLESRSLLLPQIDIGTQARIIDEDRAQSSFGTLPERQWTGSANATQLIYSDKAWSNYTVEKHRQKSRVEARQTIKLDTIQAATTAYLNFLRAKAIERIQKQNLTLTRENLERARIRESIGSAGPEEVYRWESEIAGIRQLVLAAESRRLDAMSSLNRILNRPLNEAFGTAEAESMDPLMFVKDKRFFDYLANPKNLNLLRDFLIKEGLDQAPELSQLDSAIAARERIITSARREFWLPTVAFQGNVTEIFSEDGAGTVPPGSMILPQKDDSDWSAGVFATLPLFNSGGKTATLKRAREELIRLRFERDAASNRIEEKVINSVNLMRSSYPGIWLTRDAASAANKNLKLVTNSYARGIKSIIELIDAQNQALVADQKAANALYDFLIDLMQVQRSVGNFIFFSDETERQAWSQRLSSFFEKSGIAIKNH